MKNIEVVVHVNEELNQKHRKKLPQKVCKLEGVTSANLINKLPHLMIVGYNPDKTRSLQILDGVKNYGVHAQLIGWL